MTNAKMFGIAAALSGALVLGGVHPAAAQVRVGVGVSVALPVGHAWIEFGGARYAFYDGRFYRPYRMGRFVRVAPPIGAVLTWIPEDARLCSYDGFQYFVYDNVWYEPQYLEDGTLVYVVVEIPYGVRIAPYRVYYYPRPYVVRPVPFRGFFRGVFFRDRYVDRDRYYRDHDRYYRDRDDRYGRDHYGRDRYVNRDRDRNGNRDQRANTRVRVEVPQVRVRPQPRPAPQPRIRQAEPRAGQAQPRARQAQPRARQAEPRARQAQPRVQRAEPRARQAQPRVQRAEPRARQAQPRVQPRARPAPAVKANRQAPRPQAKARPAPRRPKAPARNRGHRGNGRPGGS